MRRLISSRLFIAVACLLLGAGIVGAIWALSSGSDRGASGGKVTLSFKDGSEHHTRLLQHSGAFQHAVDTLNYELTLPSDLHVRLIGQAAAAKAGVSGPTYVAEDHTVYFPWLFVDQSLADLKALPRFRGLSHARIDHYLVHAMTFVLYHELAHGIFDLLDVPIISGEEGAADNLAAVFAIAAHSSGALIPLSGAALSEARAHRQGMIPTLSAFADHHGFDRQRAFNDLCLVYGAAPKRFRKFVKTNRLPSSRAELCPYQYQADLRAWRRLLGHWLTEHGSLGPLPR
jgi:hypothetical protein